MVFNPKKILLSHNGQYIIYENLVYDIGQDKTFNLKDVDLLFWLNFLKENSKESYKNKVKSLNEVQKIVRESMYSLSEIFDRKTKDLFIFEFERKLSNNLIIERVDVESNINSISSAWDYIIESISSYITINEQSEDKGFFSKLKSKINAGTDWLMDKGLGWFFENLRKALLSWGGAAVQVFLATYTGGFGNVFLVVVWGAMLAWDLLQGIKGNWDWVNIIIDLIGVVTTGPGAKIIAGVFKNLGILGTKLPLSGIIQKLSTSGSSTVKWFSSILSKIVSGISQIGSYMLQGVSWLSQKLGIKSLEKVSGQLKTKLNNVVDDIAKASSGLKEKVGQVGSTVKQKAGQAGTAIKTGATNVGNKLSPVGRALMSKPGQIATAAGLTAGINAYTGGDNRLFAGAYVDDESRLLSLVMNQPAEYSDEDLP